MNGRSVSVHTRIALSMAVMTSASAAAVRLVACQAAVSPAVQNERVTQREIASTCASCHDAQRSPRLAGAASDASPYSRTGRCRLEIRSAIDWCKGRIRSAEEQKPTCQ